MSSTTRPTRLEHKAAPALLDPPPSRTVSPPEPGSGVTALDDETGTVEALVAVTGVRDDVGDLLVPGCFGRTLRERTPRLCVAHDWGRVAGRVLSAVELLPGDPRLPRTAPDGTPWPRQAGALRVKARFLLGTREGREAYELAKAFGADHAYSIGYKVAKARERDGVRHIYDLDVYEFSGVLHGANRYARQLSVKSAAGAPAVRSPARDRPGLPRVVPCSTCKRPAAALVGGGLRDGEQLICASCMRAMTDAIDEHVATIDPAELAEAAELTMEEEFDAALDGEQLWEIEPDGTLAQATNRPSRGRAWERP